MLSGYDVWKLLKASDKILITGGEIAHEHREITDIFLD